MSETHLPGGHGLTAPGSHRTAVLRPARRPVRGPESLGGLLLILAGIAAAISLVLDWLGGDDISGWGLVRNGFDDLGEPSGTAASGSRWWSCSAAACCSCSAC